MKVVDRKMVSYSPVVGEWETTIEGTTEDIGKLIRALNVVEEFKTMAMKEHKIKEDNADWTMFGYDFIKDDHDDRVVVMIRQGMCG